MPDNTNYKNELWEPLVLQNTELKNKYLISSYGRIRSFAGKDKVNGKILKGSDIRGYKAICLYTSDNKPLTKYIHKLVAEHFLTKESKDQEFVVHLDYNKGNNAVTNLKWASKAQKEEHQFANPEYGGQFPKGLIRNSKLTISDVVRIKKMLKRGDLRLSKIAKMFGITHTQLNRIKSGENWGHVTIDDKE